MDNADKKKRMVSMRLTQKQFEKLTDLKSKIDLQSGFRITRASIMLKLMEFGLSRFEKEFIEETSSGHNFKKTS